MHTKGNGGRGVGERVCDVEKRGNYMREGVGGEMRVEGDGGEREGE